MNRFRWLFVLLGIVSAALAVRFVLHFPWTGTFEAMVGADWYLLAAAAVANLASLVAKGWSWHLLLRPAAPHRWRTAQAGTFVGAAVNSVSVSVSGEAARVQLVASRDAVPIGAAIWSLVWARVVEAIALVLFLALALALIPTDGWLRRLEVGAWVVLGLLAALTAFGVWPRLVGLLPAGWRPQLQGPTGAIEPARLVAPLALATVNWVAQWLSYHWAIGATHVSTSAAVSLVALVMANIGGFFRVTPGNVGVLQASLVIGMLAFHIPEDQALAAGLALQAVQVLPVIAIGVALVGAQGLRSLGSKRAESVGTA
jgi:putative heme transporter